MQRSAIWIAFLLLIFGFSVWFVVKAGYDLMRYYQFSTQVSIVVDKWDIQEIEANKYALLATYSYEYQGKNYRNAGLLRARYPNPWAAERAISTFEKETRYVWLNPQFPEKSILDKKFPYKAGLSAVVLLGLAIYFICLGVYIGVKNEPRH